MKLLILVHFFSVLVAELIKFYFDKLVEMHNYTVANCTDRKVKNWKLLNRYYELVWVFESVVIPPTLLL